MERITASKLEAQEERASKILELSKESEKLTRQSTKKEFKARKFSRNKFEKWTDVEGYDGWYKVSTSGQIWSAYSDKVIKFTPHIYSGYLKARLKNPFTDSGDTLYLHRIVAKAFLPNPLNKPQVNHNDGNRENCSVWNLAWMTEEENMRHAQMHGLGNVKLKPIEVQSIFYLCWASDKNQDEIAAMYGVSRGTVSAIKNRTSWDFMTDNKVQSEMGLFE
jgi:hypothetical protein